MKRSNQMICRLLVGALLSIHQSSSAAVDFSSDYYTILGLSKNASEKEIKMAYRRLAMQHHPDRRVGDAPEEIQKIEDKFKMVKEAYDILSDRNMRLRYDQGRRVIADPPEAIEDLKASMDQIDQTQSDEELIEKLQSLNAYREFIYRENDDSMNLRYENYTEGASLIRKFFDQMIDQNRFGRLQTAKAFLELTQTWTFQEEETTYKKTLDWGPLQSRVLQQLPMNGYTFSDILRMLDMTKITAVIDLDFRSLGGEVTYKNRTVTFDLNRQDNALYIALLKGLLASGKIKSVHDLFGVIQIIKERTDRRNHFLEKGLAGSVSSVLKLLSLMNDEQILEIVKMSAFYPAELLGLVHYIVQEQGRSINLRPEVLTKIIVTSLQMSLHHKYKESLFFAGDHLDYRQGRPLTAYLLAHPGFSEQTLKNLTDQILNEHGQTEDGYVERVREKALYTLFQKDFFDLLKIYKSTLNRAGLNANDWEQIREALGVGKLSFHTGLIAATFSTKQTINWVNALSQATKSVEVIFKTTESGTLRVLQRPTNSCSNLLF